MPQMSTDGEKRRASADGDLFSKGRTPLDADGGSRARELAVPKVRKGPAREWPSTDGGLPSRRRSSLAEAMMVLEGMKSKGICMWHDADRS